MVLFSYQNRLCETFSLNPRSCMTGRNLGGQVAVGEVDVDVCNVSWKLAVFDVVRQRSSKDLLMCFKASSCIQHAVSYQVDR
jgi:hypothetical protein